MLFELLVPVRVSECVPLVPNAIAPPFVKLKVPSRPPDALMVALLPFASPMVNKRSVLAAVEPAYLRVPPPKIRFAAAFDDAPIALALPPFAKDPAVRLPLPSIVVAPV